MSWKWKIEKEREWAGDTWQTVMIKAGNTNTATVIQVTYALRPHCSAKWPQHSNTPGDTSDREKINTYI